MIWCFAYGSNLDMDQMEKRVDPLGRYQRAFLRGWKLTFNVSSSIWGGKAANIIETGNPEDVVRGAIYQITEVQLAKLTGIEGRKPIDLEVESDGNKVIAKVYVFNPRAPSGKPTEDYLNTILSGLRRHGYDQNVIDSVREIAHESR